MKPYTSTADHNQHMEEITLNQREIDLASVVSGGQLSQFELMKNVMLQNKIKEANEASKVAKQEKEYPDNWYGRQQKETDERVQKIQNMIDKGNIK